MPAPQSITPNVPLTAFAVGYSPGKFIARKVLPVIPVNDRSGTYYIYDRSNFQNNNDGPRGYSEPARRVDYQVSTGTYELQYYDLYGFLPEREAANHALGRDAAEESVIANVMDQLMLAEEVRAAALLFNATNITQNTTLSGTSQWSDYTSGVSNPVGVIQTGISTVRDAVSEPEEALSITMGAAVWDKLRHHPDIVDRYKYVAGGGVNKRQFAELFDLNPENINIGMSNYDSANEGQTDVIANIWGKDLLVHFTNPAPRGLRTHTLGATLTRAGSEAYRVLSWRENNPEGDNHKVETEYQQKLIAAAAGYLVVDAVA